MIIKGAHQDTYIKKQVDEKLAKKAEKEEIPEVESLSNEDIDKIFEEEFKS